jgi:hypothetical protein
LNSRKNLRSWARLRLLSCAGLDVMSAAPELFAVVHELVPGAACALFLTDADGTPHGFHHEDSPAAVRSLFQAEPQLFKGPDELNVFQLVGRRGSPKVGQLLEPPRSYFASNTYQLLVRASGHHHSLDVRLEPDGAAAGMLALFRAPGRGFDGDEAAQVQRIGLHLEHALRAQPAGGQSVGGDLPGSFDEEAMLVARPDGSVMFASDAAHAMLGALPLVGPAWPDRRRLPLLALHLIERLRDPARFPDRLPFARWAVAGGFIEATAQWLGAQAAVAGAAAEGAQAFAEGLIGIVLRRRSPEPLRVWRRLRAVALAPQAMEAAFWLALTGERDAVRSRMGLSEAVMKDCLKAVYAELGVSSVAEVVGALRSDGGAAIPGALARVPAGVVASRGAALRLAA